MENLSELILLLMALGKVVVNLTPTEKDNKYFKWLDYIVDAVVPNLKKGGGKH